MELCVNNAWSGSAVFGTRAGTVGAYADRCVQLHNDRTGEVPDVILVFLGTNDFSYTYEGGELGDYDLGLDHDIDYASLIRSNADGSYTYAAPTTSTEAYAAALPQRRNLLYEPDDPPLPCLFQGRCRSAHGVQCKTS